MADDAKRQCSEMRSTCCQLSILNKADGSASFSQGSTQLIAAAYGPAEVKVNKEIIDKATLEVVFKPKVGLPGCGERLVQEMIKNSCEPVTLTAFHPRTSLMLVVQVVQDSGSLLSCAINASCLAMIDAGFPMKCMVCAVTCAVSETGEIQLDPSLEQDKASDAVMTFSFESCTNNVVASSTKGSYTLEKYNSCLAACKKSASKLFAFFRQSIERKLSKWRLQADKAVNFRDGEGMQVPCKLRISGQVKFVNILKKELERLEKMLITWKPTSNRDSGKNTN